VTLDPTPPPLTRLRLHARHVRRLARWLLAGLLADAARHLDPTAFDRRPVTDPHGARPWRRGRATP
jgi:hypothetical protein